MFLVRIMKLSLFKISQSIYWSFYFLTLKGHGRPKGLSFEGIMERTLDIVNEKIEDWCVRK